MAEGEQYVHRPGAYIICVQGDKAAVVRIPKGFFLLGGGIEQGESQEECIHREVLEEIGYTVEIDGYLCSAEEYREHPSFGYFHPIQYYYVGRLKEKVAEPVELDHTLEWIPVEELPGQLYVRSQKWALQQYISRQENGVGAPHPDSVGNGYDTE